jgi:hypothetical protein
MRFLRRSTWGYVAAAATLLLAGMHGDARAQLQNPGFESPDASGGDVPGTANWNTFNNVFTTATLFRSGTQCLKTFGPFVPAGGSGGTQALAAAPGETWVGEIYAMNSSTDPIDNVDFGVYKIEFRNASGQLAAGGLFGVDIFESNQIGAATPQDTWTLLGVGTAPAPAGTAFAQAVIVKVDMDGTQGGSIFWDDARLQRFVIGVADAPMAPIFALQPNVPNPFNPTTRIDFALAERSAVNLSVYDVTGRLVVTLLDGQFEAGPYAVTWNGRAANGTAAPAGVYCYVLATPGGRSARNMTLVK